MDTVSANKPMLEPAIFVIFGITGDLAQRRLLPALYHLIKDNLLPEHTEIVGVSRQAMSPSELLTKIEVCVLETDTVCDPIVLKKFRSRLKMIRLDPIQSEDYAVLGQTLQDIETTHGMCMNRLYYLAIPPQVYQPVIQNLGAHHLQAGCPHHEGVARLLVEKPFGYDLVSAKELIRATSNYFSEDQIFRIDHYLAKETVQNILVFRQHNPIFASLWNNQHIKSIEIDLYEQIGVEGRREFYDNVGALRDVVQNHLLQLLALVTMELPTTSHSSALHKAKQALLASITAVDVHHPPLQRAQYRGYAQEVNNPRSQTETFVRLALTINNHRWKQVPITLATGKALYTKKTTIVIKFGASSSTTDVANQLTFRIQPNEGIDVELVVKRPGFVDKTELVQMDFSYHGAFNEPSHPDAYERVVVDAVKGDHSLFATSQEVLESWRILQPILDAWEQSSQPISTYEMGSEGPKAIEV